MPPNHFGDNLLNSVANWPFSRFSSRSSEPSKPLKIEEDAQIRASYGRRKTADRVSFSSELRVGVPNLPGLRLGFEVLQDHLIGRVSRLGWPCAAFFLFWGGGGGFAGRKKLANTQEPSRTLNNPQEPSGTLRNPQEPQRKAVFVAPRLFFTMGLSKQTAPLVLESVFCPKAISIIHRSFQSIGTPFAEPCQNGRNPVVKRNPRHVSEPIVRTLIVAACVKEKREPCS